MNEEFPEQRVRFIRELADKADQAKIAGLGESVR
jgi:hypothetical protein